MRWPNAETMGVCGGAIVALVVLAVSYRTLPIPESEQVIIRLQLPEGAQQVEDLGNNWHAFSLEAAGKKRRFLRHYPNGIVSGESVVELSP